MSSADAYCVERLRRLLDITRQMAGTTDLDELLRTIVAAAVEVLACERATIFLYDKARNELYSRVATGIRSLRVPADRGIAGAAAQQRVVVNVPDAYADARFNPAIDRQTGFRTRNLLAIPLENLTGELVGVLQTLNKRDGAFTPEDEELARTLAAQAGVALHRQALLDEYAQKQRMARDLELARQIQQALFPKTNPVVAGYEIAGWNRSADETGGDCYDFISLAEGRQALLLADATGHGIGAALVIAQCRSLLRALLSMTDDLARIAARVNEILSEDLTDDRFVTAFVGLLDPRRHRLDYLSAGQGPLLFVHAGGVEERRATGLPLAVVADMPFDVEAFEFAPGDTVALLTDGFFETTNSAGEQYGVERVAQVLRARAGLPLDALIRDLNDDISRFSGNAPPADDLTAVFVRRRD
ncbi:MAG: GAF domain-containing SpoIIE family protein phosphatase [Planctomycetota bacterium]